MVEDKEVKLEGNLALVGFEILEPSELSIIRKIVSNYVRKMCDNGNYKEMRLTLQQKKHGKSFKHEINGLALFKEGRFHSSKMDWNLYTTVSDVCEAILQELLHARKKEQRHDKVTYNR